MQASLSRVCDSVEIIELEIGTMKFRESSHVHGQWKRSDELGRFILQL